MKKEVTKIAILLDRSGSMEPLRDSVIEGINGYIRTQQEGPDEATITIYRFDDEFETIVKDEDVKTEFRLTRDSYKPRGSTALLDSIAKGIHEFESVARGAAQVLFVIQTDGEENSSTEYKGRFDLISDLIRRKTAEGWQFTFLGANIDAIGTASKLGIAGATAMQFSANAASNAALYKTLGQKTNCYRGTKGQLLSVQADSLSYTAEERKSVL